MVIYVQRYFAKEKVNNEFILNDDDIKHIKLVMRMKDNDEIIIVYNEEAYLCYINNINESLKIIEKQYIGTKNLDIPYVCLIIPVLKEQKMDYILQKATELGVEEIIPFYSKRGIIKEKEDKTNKKIDRWKRILKEASEQTHRNDIPKITEMKKLEELNLNGSNLICSTVEESRNIKKVLKSINKCDRINVVIGPEGGLDPSEEKNLIEKQYIPITLGKRILRVETVPLFLMSTINYEYME